MIVTQSCPLPHGFDNIRPEVKMGERERCVRQWLELNGTLFLVSLLTSFSCSLQVKNTSGWSRRNSWTMTRITASFFRCLLPTLTFSHSGPQTLFFNLYAVRTPSQMNIRLYR